jgi:hypothetical protein
MLSGSAWFSGTTSGSKVEITLPVVDLKNATSDVNFPLSGDQLISIAQNFKNDKGLKITILGSLSEVPVGFKMVCTIKAKITAEAI